MYMNREARVLYQVTKHYAFVNHVVRISNLSAYSQLFGAEQNCNEDPSSPTKYFCFIEIYLINGVGY